jgi:hypothetical protein
MRQRGRDSTHLNGVTFELRYPPSPFYPYAPVFAKFSGVLNPDGRLHAKLDSGSIPDSSATPGIPIRGTFTIAPGEGPLSFSGFLSNNRIDADAEVPPG